MDCTVNLLIKPWIKLVALVAGWIEEIKGGGIYIIFTYYIYIYIKFQCLMITTLTGVRGHLIVVLRPSSKSLQTVNAGEGMEKGNPPTLLAGM